MTQATLPCADSTLWERLQGYRFDPTTVDHPFERRLASAERWSLRKARRVVEEYRRFVFLALVADHAVTPSRAVDAAWHLHLLDTRGYWEEFCPAVLGRPLHHEPGRGATSESARHQEQYARTLTAYRRCFGTDPPPDIWPAPVSRRPAATLLWALPALLLVVGAALPANSGTHLIHRPESLLQFQGAGIGLAVAWTVFWRLQETLAVERLQPRRVQATLQTIDSHTLAWLAGGLPSLVAVSLFNLYRCGLIGGTPERFRVLKWVRAAPDPAVAASSSLHGVDRALLDHLSRHRGFVDRAMQMERLLLSNKVGPELTALNRTLEAIGLRRTRGQHRRRLLLLLLPWLPLQLLGAVAAVSQFSKQGPMGGTLALLALSLVLPAVGLARSGLLTPVGHRCRAEVHRQSWRKTQPVLEGEDADCPLRLVAMGGMGVIATVPALASLAKAYTPCPGLGAAMRQGVWECFRALSWRAVGIGGCGGGGACCGVFATGGDDSWGSHSSSGGGDWGGGSSSCGGGESSCGGGACSSG